MIHYSLVIDQRPWLPTSSIFSHCEGPCPASTGRSESESESESELKSGNLNFSYISHLLFPNPVELITKNLPTTPKSHACLGKKRRNSLLHPRLTPLVLEKKLSSKLRPVCLRHYTSPSTTQSQFQDRRLRRKGSQDSVWRYRSSKNLQSRYQSLPAMSFWICPSPEKVRDPQF